MNRPWFDGETGMLLFDEYVAEMPSFRRIMADEVITGDELKEQAQRVPLAGTIRDPRSAVTDHCGAL